ncbi:hypothetical protein GQ55_9G119500 [Panicum hallii var. hallii]|uniref:Uncharacterized protein n=1 Tax=Panicum hallii var. hallii TaxID=1504633 RepID=A0A2T7C297_9POAL|nr:hypothetical protein GQ55_9G119500 [Panicum hallii var. hallii]
MTKNKKTTCHSSVYQPTRAPRDSTKRGADRPDAKACAQPNSKATRGQQGVRPCSAAKPLPGRDRARRIRSSRRRQHPPESNSTLSDGGREREVRKIHPPTRPPVTGRGSGKGGDLGGAAATGGPNRASARKAMGSGLGTAAAVNPGASSQPARSSTYAFTRAAAAAERKVMGRREAA